MGKVLEKLNKINKAIEQYETVVEIDHPNSFALYRIACCHNKLGNVDLAISYYKKTIEEDPVHDEAWMSLSTIYYKQNEFLLAKEQLIKALEIDSENIKYWELYSKINLNLGEYDEVEISCREIISLGELNLSTIIFLTKTILELPELTSLSEEILKRMGNLPQTYSGEIKYLSYVILFNSKNIEKANIYLKEAYRQNPAVYDYFRDIFPTIPQLHVFKNMNAN